jgi:hypothetical protein
MISYFMTLYGISLYNVSEISTILNLTVNLERPDKRLVYMLLVSYIICILVKRHPEDNHSSDRNMLQINTFTSIHFVRT